MAYTLDSEHNRIWLIGEILWVGCNMLGQSGMPIDIVDGELRHIVLPEPVLIHPLQIPMLDMYHYLVNGRVIIRGINYTVEARDKWIRID